MKLPKVIFKYNYITTFLSILTLLLGSLTTYNTVKNKSLFLITPRPHDIIFESLISKLTMRDNSFSIKNTFTLIPQAFASSEYTNASSYIAIDNNTGEVILEKDPSLVLPIASLTKMMTAIIALDLVPPNELLTISKNASQVVPTKIGVVPGQKMTLVELLHAMLMTSANDAAQVVKDAIDRKYSEEVFIRLMNEKAHFLGMKNTHFDNPQGFDSSENYSSAYDLALLSHYALSNYPVIAEIVKKDYQKLPLNTNHKEFDLNNWNGLLDVYPNIYGVKIGNTAEAGATIIVGSERQGKTILVVLLGTPGILERDLWASKILDDSFQKQFGFAPIGVTIKQLQEKYSTWKYWN